MGADFPSFSLSGKKALVTGSSSGIGRSIALALAEAGADVVVHGLQYGAAAKDVIRDIAAKGVKSFWVEGDLADAGGRVLGESVQRTCGDVDILVLNASIQKKSAFGEITAEDSACQFRSNFQSSLELIQVLAPAMRLNKWGRILTIGSVQQARPHPEMLVYAATKAAQLNMVLNLAAQFAADGVTVNNLAPGVILTDRNSEALSDPGYAEKVLGFIPAGFFGEPADCAGAALLLCSEAGRYITGQNLYVDGGMGLS